MAKVSHKGVIYKAPQFLRMDEQVHSTMDYWVLLPDIDLTAHIIDEAPLSVLESRYSVQSGNEYSLDHLINKKCIIDYNNETNSYSINTFL